MSNSLYEMYSKEQIDKIGNTVVFLASKINCASKTKIIKLLYILDEISIKKSGIPFLNLEYKVWKFGPVANDIFVEFSSSPSMLKDFIDRKTTLDGHDYIIPKQKFVDDEFSQNELDLLDFVITKFKDSTTEDLIAYTHRKNSPWYNAALKNSVLELLESEKISTTDIIIDMSELVEYDERKLGIYKECVESF